MVTNAVIELVLFKKNTVTHNEIVSVSTRAFTRCEMPPRKACIM